MNSQQPVSDMIRFMVVVGHKSVIVECRTKEEAVEIARRQLCLELPRMWDVIRSLDAARFEVSRAA